MSPSEITSLVTDMHASADKIIEMFRGMRVDESSSQSEHSIAENPAKLCYVAKQCLREAAVGRFLNLYFFVCVRE